MKIKLLDLCICGEDNIDIVDSKEMFEEYNGRWDNYIRSVNNCNIDGEWFVLSDVDKNVFILDDGGELFRLKDGYYVTVCWRGDCCRVWYEDDEERIKYFNDKLKVK